jgi:DNA uptake protein ComE-like DNA-binding protein
MTLMFSSLTVSAANRYVSFSGTVEADVVSVLDGDAIEVRLANGGLALVRLLGVVANSEEAFRWLTNELTGKRVTLTVDPTVRSADRWNLAYVYLSGEFINARILRNGLGRPSANIDQLSLRTALNSAANHAKTAGSGLWDFKTDMEVKHYNEKLNINTATAAQMAEMLEINIGIAENIAAYRVANPYRKLTDIKFVQGMTKAVYDAIRYKITCVTDINAASFNELMTLFDMTETLAGLIITERSKGDINDWARDFVDMSAEPHRTFRITQRNAPFITESGNTEINFPANVVNINTASRNLLMTNGLTNAQATAIVEQREKYPLKSLGELLHVRGAGLTFSVPLLNHMSYRFVVRTDLNNASEYELRSLLNVTGTGASLHPDVRAIIENRPFTDITQVWRVISSETQQAIREFVYIGGIDTDFVNINTASDTQLVNAGYSRAAAWELKSNIYLTPRNLTELALTNADRISVVTNVNTASVRELESLGAFMTDEIVQAALVYRHDQPFGSVLEFRTFLVENKVTLTQFNFIERFISVR